MVSNHSLCFLSDNPGASYTEAPLSTADPFIPDVGTTSCQQSTNRSGENFSGTVFRKTIIDKVRRRLYW